MKPNHVRELLAQALAELAEARRHLDYSYQQVATLPHSLAGLNESQLESIEAFTSRFARAVDLLVNKVLRSLDRVELKPPGTLLDTVNRAEQRAFIDRADTLREMKDVRNMIAHDYAGANAGEIAAYCREQKPVFDATCDRVAVYVRQLLSST
jgi:uncharacterized protein YutE (UPF0331/DUF86 family)